MTKSQDSWNMFFIGLFTGVAVGIVFNGLLNDTTEKHVAYPIERVAQ